MTSKINPSILSNLILFSRRTGLSKYISDNHAVTMHGIQWPTKAEYFNLIKKISIGEISYVLNDGNWGLGKEKIPEYKVLTATWDKKKS